MVALAFHKVISLPGSLAPNAFYFVEAGTYAESYLTDDTGAARSIGNTAMIQAIAGALIATELAELNQAQFAADIAARNAMATEDRNMMVYVADATGDPTVASGAALYFFRNSDNSWHKVAEYEGLDVAVSWSSISGKPSSAPSLIDDAVTKRHTHANASYLDKIGETAGKMTYDGQPVGASEWGDTDW